jgi:drug/metabolite transporter (DMT)-like permease
MPFLGLTPVFTIFTGWMLRGETISMTGILGIFIVFIGTIGIDTKSIKDWITLGGKRVFRDKGVLLVIIVALLYSVSSVYDKTATLLSDPYTFVWYSAIIRAIALMLIWYGRNSSFSVPKTGHGFSLTHFSLFGGLGVSFAAEALFQMFALQTGLVAYVIAIKRLSILMTSLVGMIAYKEVFSWGRLSGAVLIVLGAGIIYMS